MFIYYLDLIGVFSCSVAASLLAKQKGMDFSGAIMVAMVGAVGGGTLRDLILNRHPIFWLEDLNYMMLISVTALMVQVFYFRMDKYSSTIRWFDAFGLGAFSILGFEAASRVNMHSFVVVLMGVITAVVGGIGRDIICREIPYVLRKEIYIFASIIGGIMYLLMSKIGVPDATNQLITLAVIVMVRMFSYYKDWHLPDLTLR